MMTFVIIGWILFIVPIIAFTIFSAWMFKCMIVDDENVGTFVYVMLAIWLSGAGILTFYYLTRWLT